MEPKPQDLGEYRWWLEHELRERCDAVVKRHCETAVQALANQTQGSAFWRTVLAQTREMDEHYRRETGWFLFMDKTAPSIDQKSFDSILDKSFRKNVVYNGNWDRPPADDWIRPSNWFNRVNDLVRTCFVVKYLDGVPFLVAELSRIADQLGLNWSADFEAREEGYYAAHFYAGLSGEIPSLNWDTQQTDYLFEVQITTQLQEAIRPITHHVYALRRSQVERPALKWQWQYETEEFRINYLSHTLHHVEGLIIDVRNRGARRE